MKRHSISGFTIIVIGIIFLCGPAFAVPGLISYQGKLTDNTGTAIEGTQNMRFRLYNNSVGGTELWHETHSGVSVTAGIYDVRLGLVTTLDESLFVGDAVYLQVEINNGSDWEVLSPRQQLTSMAFAFKAVDAETLEGKTVAEIHAEETDPTVIASVKDGVAWTELSNIPVGFADGTDADSGGDITGVTAGNGLVGGGDSGSVTLNIGAGTGIYVAPDGIYVDTSVIQERVTDTCPAGQSIRLISAAGSVLCEPDDIGIQSCDVCDSRFVNVTGDTMTGALWLPANGLAVGTNQLVVTGGKVGLGLVNPNEQLELTGNLRLPVTSATTGIIRSGADTLLHTYGTDNFFAGKRAGNLTMTGQLNTGNGSYALSSNSTGYSNTANGSYALSSNTTGDGNTAIGRSVLTYNTIGGSNTATGYGALFSNINGNGNTASGDLALELNTTGGNNTAFGKEAGHANTVGSFNTFLGYTSNVTVNNLTNATAIGYGAVVSDSNRVRIGNTSVTQIGGQVAWSNLSDMRHKRDIGDIGLGLDFITALRPVQFRMIEGNDRLDFGFIAQDIEALLGEEYNILGIDGAPDRTLSLRYADFIAPMVKAMQEQQGQIEEQQGQIEEQKKIIERQEGFMSGMRSEIEALKAQGSEIEALKAEIKAIRAGR